MEAARATLPRDQHQLVGPTIYVTHKVRHFVHCIRVAQLATCDCHQSSITAAFSLHQQQ